MSIYKQPIIPTPITLPFFDPSPSVIRTTDNGYSTEEGDGSYFVINTYHDVSASSNFVKKYSSSNTLLWTFAHTDVNGSNTMCFMGRALEFDNVNHVMYLPSYEKAPSPDQFYITRINTLTGENIGTSQIDTSLTVDYSGSGRRQFIYNNKFYCVASGASIAGWSMDLSTNVITQVTSEAYYIDRPANTCLAAMGPVTAHITLNTGQILIFRIESTGDIGNPRTKSGRLYGTGSYDGVTYSSLSTNTGLDPDIYYDIVDDFLKSLGVTEKVWRL